MVCEYGQYRKEGKEGGGLLKEVGDVGVFAFGLAFDAWVVVSK